jgi:predicted nucleotidyltransferase
MKREDVIRIIHEQQKELVESYQVTYLSLFGAVARGETAADNKVGILVKFARPIRFLQFFELKKHLETLLGCKVEIGKTRSLRPEFRTMILQEAIRVI